MTKSIFDLDEFKPYRGAFDARQTELARRAAYYDGSIYSSVHWFVRGLPVALVTGVKMLYQPVARAVNVDAGIVPGGWKLDAAAAPLQPGVDRVLSWSRWDTEGVLYVHYGALYGEVVLRVADLRAQNRIVIAPTNPICVFLTPTSIYDRTPRLALVVERRTDENGAEFEYAEAIDALSIRTFKDGAPHGFDARPAEYANALGFVPFVSVPHIHNGGALGDCAFARAIPLLDEVNAMATDVGTIIRKHMKEPQWGIVGAEPGNVSKGADIWFVPAGGDFKVLVPEIDLAGMLSYLDRISKQLEKTMPELAFDELTSKQFVATPTVQLQLLELVLLVKRVRPNYDAGLVAALRMAGRAAAGMCRPCGSEDAAGSELAEIAALDDDALAFDANRPVLPIADVEIASDQRSEKEFRHE